MYSLDNQRFRPGSWSSSAVAVHHELHHCRMGGAVELRRGQGPRAPPPCAGDEVSAAAMLAGAVSVGGGYPSK